jgi:hypothetical protein
MMMPTYVFRNRVTGETRQATADAQNPARRMIPGIFHDPNWTAWECWDGSECIWHFDTSGEVHSGPRPQASP